METDTASDRSGVAPIYLDYAATTPIASSVRAAMMPWIDAGFGNASSLHRDGRDAAAAVESARADVAALIGARPLDVVFTSGGTESNNLAIKGVMLHPNRRNAHVVTTAAEHKAVLAPCHFLEALGFGVTIVAVDGDGVVDPEDVRRAMTDETALVSVMHANNEIGSLQPVAEIAAIAKAHGALFHVDAVQTVGHLPVDVDALGCDLLSLSAHKFYGPKGVGALYVRGGADGFVSLAPLFHGGFQEEGVRAGTLNTAGIVGLGAAARRCDDADLIARAAREAALRDRLIDGLLARVPAARLTGSRRDRLPGSASFTVRGVDGEAAVVALDWQGIRCSTGSACTTGQIDPSHVLLAIGRDPDDARGALRFSLGEGITADDVDRAIDLASAALARMT